MSENGIAAVMAILVCVVILVSFWKQILVILLLAVTAVFCVGVYYIVGNIYP